MTTFATSHHYGRLPPSADGRAPNPASYPETPETSRSYWQREFRDTISEGADKTALPSVVDVVIIGSGVTGAAVAYRLAKEEPGLTVAVVEARGFCSGATGRNGGHICRPEVFDFVALSELLGVEDAVKVKRTFIKNRDILLDTVEELGIADEVDLRLSGTIEVFKNQEHRDKYLVDNEAAKKNGYHSEATIMSADEARKFLDLGQDFPQAGAAYLKRSGAIWPRKLVQGVFRGAQKRMPGLSIHTYTPVTNVSREGDESNPTYTVTTSRGTIRARAVFHATNAYASHLIPSLGGEEGVQGVKCHVMAIQPNKPASDVVEAKGTHLAPGFGYDEFWHWIVQVPSQGPFTYGYTRTATYNDYDDTTTYPSSVPGRQTMYNLLESAFPAAFDKIDAARDVTHDWTGIMGFTPKGNSLVGKVSKDSAGEFMSVGHNGEGMSRCFACAEVATGAMLAYLKSDKSWTAPDWIPECYKVNI